MFDGCFNSILKTYTNNIHEETLYLRSDLFLYKLTLFIQLLRANFLNAKHQNIHTTKAVK